MPNPSELKNITPELLESIKVVERSDSCNRVRKLPIDAPYESIRFAARSDAADIEATYLELAHFASDLKWFE
jgi:hypothetical protein